MIETDIIKILIRFCKYTSVSQSSQHDKDTTSTALLNTENKNENYSSKLKKNNLNKEVKVDL